MTPWTVENCETCIPPRLTPCVMVDGVMVCAACLVQMGQQQLNRQALDAGTASMVPGPADYSGRRQQRARLFCEGCHPVPTDFVSWSGPLALWLCDPCIAEVARRLHVAPR